MATHKLKSNGIDKPLNDLATVIRGWSQAAAIFHGKFVGLAKEIEAIDQQPDSACSTKRKPRLNRLKKIASESVQLLEQLIVDMDCKYDVNQESTQASIERLYYHTIQLQKQTERIDGVLRINKFQSVYTYANSKVVRAKIMI